jgi:hypothetical protein
MGNGIMEPVEAVYVGAKTIFKGPDGWWYNLHTDADEKVTYCEQIGNNIQLYLYMHGLGE